MCATSIAMQPASAMPSVCTGDGPAAPALSSVIVASPLVAANVRPPSHVRSTIVCGFEPTRGL